MVGFQFGAIHARTKNGIWTFWAEQHDSEHETGLVGSRVAVLIIGSARTLVWPAVCQNINTNLVDGLRQRKHGSVRWHVDVFLFIALTDAGPKGRNLSGHRHGVDELSPCKDILKPVHVELMPETYPMPKHESCLSEQDMPNYWNQTTFWHVAGASERKYSQCRRVVEAFTYVQRVYEPKAGIRYDAWVRARTDSVYLAPVPPMADFDLRKLTSTSLAMMDHWHLVSRDCKTAIPVNCIREKDAAWLRKTQGITQLAARPKAHEKQGYLFLECDRWSQECARLVNKTKDGQHSVNGSWHSCDPSPCRKMQLEFLKAELPGERAQLTEQRGAEHEKGLVGSRVAVLIIGSARTLVWPAVCQNMKANLVDGLRQRRKGSVQWHVDVFFFIALTDAGPKGRNRSGQSHDIDELSQCRDILKPVHVELMPEAYPMPEHESCLSARDMPNYWNQTTFWNVAGASERKYSQCRRVVEAFTYVEKVYEPNTGIRYDAWVRARTDSVYLAPVPPMADFDLGKLTSTSLAMVDHWHLVSRDCKTALPFNCIKCGHSQFDECQNRPGIVRSFAMQAVVAREYDAAFLRKTHGFTRLPARPKPHEKQGYLFLECQRFIEECARLVNKTKDGKHTVNGSWHFCDPSPCRKMQLEFLQAPLPQL
eukprot:s1637_g2.t1